MAGAYAVFPFLGGRRKSSGHSGFARLQEETAGHRARSYVSIVQTVSLLSAEYASVFTPWHVPLYRRVADRMSELADKIPMFEVFWNGRLLPLTTVRE